MRILTFSVLKKCRIKALVQTLRKYSNALEVEKKKYTGDPTLLEFPPVWSAAQWAELRTQVEADMKVMPGFISEDEEKAMLEELEPQLRRMRYEFDHWDNAIHGFRETERSKWSEASAGVLSRVRAAAFSDAGAGRPLPHAHVLDLAAAGHIKPHVDAVRFCGEVIAGVCLASTAVMRLEHTQHKELSVDALLPRRCLYIMRGVARYDLSHAVLGGEHSTWRGEPVPRRRRVAVITRSQPKDKPQGSDHSYTYSNK